MISMIDPAPPLAIYDMVIMGGRVIDVMEETISQKNIGIMQGKIAAITEMPLHGILTLDATGLLVSPGFVDFHSHVDGNVYAATCLVKQGGTTTIGGERDLNSRTIREIEENGFIINQGFVISQSFVLRSAVGITDIYKNATDMEINAMCDLARRFFEYGAFGISFGLELIPGTSRKEMLKISRVAKDFELPILIHMRKDGMEALKHFDEIIEVAGETGVSVQLLQLMYMVGIGGAMPYALDIIDDARKAGLDIMADSGVYDAYTVCIGTGVFDEGWEKEYYNTSANELLIASGTYMGEYCNDALFRYLRAEYPTTLVTAFVCDPDAIGLALKKDYVFVSTNAADGPFYPGVGSPEVAGTFPRLLGRYVREMKELDLIVAIKKITIQPAQRYGLVDVGSLEVGKNADIVIFDEHKIIDKASFVGKGRPDEPPEGIKYVIVNGKVVVKDNNITENTHAGRLIKRRL